MSHRYTMILLAVFMLLQKCQPAQAGDHVPSQNRVDTARYKEDAAQTKFANSNSKYKLKVFQEKQVTIFNGNDQRPVSLSSHYHRQDDVHQWDRQLSGAARKPDAQGRHIGPVVTGILPGLPSPMMAVVDRTGGIAWSEKSMGGRFVDPGGNTGRAASGSSIELPSDGATPVSPISVAASISPDGQQDPDSLLLPFDQHVGAAAFRRANLLMVVFDSSKPMDLAPAAGNAIFGAAAYSLLSSGALMTVPLRTDEDFELVRKPSGWLIRIGKPRLAVTPITANGGSSGIMLSAEEPGRVVIIRDPVLETDLLVGTVRKDHQNVTVSRSAYRYVLIPTILGVVVERLTDRLEMHVLSNGFMIGEPHNDGAFPSGLRLLPQTFLSKTLDLPALDDAELERRYKAALTSASSVPAANRRGFRLNAAEAALALGQAREAGQLAVIADEDAPAASNIGKSIFLQATAAVVSSLPSATTLLDDPRVPNSDEVMMWRALSLAQREPGNADAARVISRCLPLLMGYPVPLREQLLGDAAISLSSQGDARDDAQVRDLPGGGKVKLAQATVLTRGSQSAQALATFDELAADADPAVRLAAASRAVELRLRLGKLNPAQAADRLDPEILDARMADDELSLRFRVAALRAQAADWPATLDTLRQISTSFPEASARVQRMSADVFEQMMRTETSAVSPLDVGKLGLIEGNLDLLPVGADRTRISIKLAQRLTELDLPDRASALIKDALAPSTSDGERARLGLELAQLRLEQTDAVGALAALDGTAAANLPADVSESRTIVRARANAASGQTDVALATLAPLQGPEVDDLRASQLAIKQDWHGEADALASLVAHEVPATGRLSASMEDLVLRLIAATARARDQEALRLLAAKWCDRFGTRTKLDLLRLLTSDHVKTEADLARSAAELPISQSALLGLTTARAGGG